MGQPEDYAVNKFSSRNFHRDYIEEIPSVHAGSGFVNRFCSITHLPNDDCMTLHDCAWRAAVYCVLAGNTHILKSAYTLIPRMEVF